MKMKAVLSFQILMRKDGESFHKGQSLDSNLIVKYPKLALSRLDSNIIRKSGITITSAGFGQITPIDSRIQIKMVENWKAKL
jgi:hypothetical protein